VVLIHLSEPYEIKIAALYGLVSLNTTAASSILITSICLGQYYCRC